MTTVDTTGTTTEDGEARALRYLRRATTELQTTKARLADLEEAKHAPIAVLGAGCRYPGGIDSPEALWDAVVQGRDSIGGFPTDRGWDVADLDLVAHRGGFLDGLPDFDADFFGISPREATAMAPQQRLALEVCWEALEHSGIDPTSLRGEQVGVFLGSNQLDYGLSLPEIPAEFAGHMTTGATASAVSGRVSYVLGLTGPSLTVDTACSSSLVAVHLALRALRSGECTMAVVGGVAAMANPMEFVGFGAQNGLAADGRCKAFSDAADGMGLAEGAGAIVLTRLTDAHRDGRRVLAVLRGSAVNSDGASNGLIAPNGPAQQRVVRAALADARLTADAIDLIEAHGTGTTLGDPIEAHALATVFADRTEPLPIGSVKSNVGHTQAAAGVAGLLKVVMGMRHGVIPPSLHVAEPSSHIDWTGLRLVGSPEPWPTGERTRRAGVSGFGVSGTNAHVVVEEAPPYEPSAPELSRLAPPGATLLALPISAHTRTALTAQADRVADRLRADETLDLVGLARTLAVGRAQRRHRAVVLAADRDSAIAGLTALAGGTVSDDVITGRATDDAAVFVYPGQGSQWDGMAADLIESPAFRTEFDACAEALGPHLDFSVHDVLAGGPGAPDRTRTDVVQPLQWAVCAGLTAMWSAAGIRPAAVIGQSQGEMAAAAAAAGLSRAEAARLVAVRSRLIAQLPGDPGGMLAVVESAESLSRRIAGCGGDLVVGAVNSPTNAVATGPTPALMALQESCVEDGVRCGRVDIGYASHSSLMAPVEDPLHAALGDLTWTAPRVPMQSTVTGAAIEDTPLDAAYWYANLRAPVRLADAVRAQLTAGRRTFLEVGPHPVLGGAIAATVDDIDPGLDGASLATLRRNQPGWPQFLRAAAQAWTRGLPVRWGAVLPAPTRDSVPARVPTSVYERRRHWLEAPPTIAATDVTAPFWDAVTDGDAATVAELLAPGDPAARGVEEIVASMPLLAAWHSRRVAAVGADGWRLVVEWSPLPDPGPSTDIRTRRWFVVCGPDGVGEVGAEWVVALRAAGVEVEVGPACAMGSADVVVLLATDTGPDATDTLQTLVDTARVLGSGALLWCVTSGAVAVGSDDPAPEPSAAALWGAGRVVALELPSGWGGLVDVPAHPGTAAVDRLIAAIDRPLSAGGTEDQIAIRANGTLGCRLRHAPAGVFGAGGWRTSGTALVTGGTGGVGIPLCRWLADRGAQHLVVASRRGGAAPGADEVRAELADAGIEVTFAACDLATPGGLDAALRATPADRPLRSVFHLAGVMENAVLADVTVESLRQAWSVKAAAALELDRLTAEMDLDAFVLFSSNAGVWGSAGQYAYAAANAALDALATRRVARGSVATSVAWGAWGEVGLSHDPEAAERLRSRGVLPMPPVAALDALDSALSGATPAVAVSNMRWDRFVETFTAARPSPLVVGLARDVDDPGDSGTDVDGDSGAELRTRLADLDRVGAHSLLVDLVTTAAGAAMGRGPDQPQVRPEVTFADSGADSLIAVDMRNRLRASTGLALPSTVVFDHPTPDELARHLVENLVSPVAGRGDDPAASALAALAEVESNITALRGDARASVMVRMQSLIAGLDMTDPDDVDVLATGSADEVLELISREFGEGAGDLDAL